MATRSSQSSDPAPAGHYGTQPVVQKHFSPGNSDACMIQLATSSSSNWSPSRISRERVFLALLGPGGGGQLCRFTISLIQIGANGDVQPFEHG